MVTKIMVMKKEIGKMPVAIEIDNSLESKQALVGGLIELIQLDNGIDMWINEEGLLNGSDWNFGIFQVEKAGARLTRDIVGNVFFSATDKDGVAISLTPRQITAINKKFLLGSEYLVANF